MDYFIVIFVAVVIVAVVLWHIFPLHFMTFVALAISAGFLWHISPLYFIILASAILLMLWAQWRVKSRYARAMEVPTDISGAAAARRILDEAGLQEVGIEQVGGLSGARSGSSTPTHDGFWGTATTDHYDPRHKVLRLSSDVYHQRTAAAVGMAAHEAGHALQDAQGSVPLVIRSAAVLTAHLYPSLCVYFFFACLVFGAMAPLLFMLLFMILVIGFSMVVVLQLVNLPVEFDASNRAKRLLHDVGMVDTNNDQAVVGVLNSAAWTNVAATLQPFFPLYKERPFLSGRVTYEGEPVPAGRLAFIPDDSQANSGPTSTIEFHDGQFTILDTNKVVGGKYVVEIEGFDYDEHSCEEEDEPSWEEDQEMKRLFPVKQRKVDLPASGGTFDFELSAD